MSSNLAYAGPVRSPRRFEPEAPRRLELAPSRAARPRVAYGVWTIASVLVIFAAQLLLSIVVSQGAYDIQALQAQQKDLQRTEDALLETLNLYGSTQNLAASAVELGMVQGSNQRFLDLTTGSAVRGPKQLDHRGCGAQCTAVPNSLLDALNPSFSNSPPATAEPADAAPPGAVDSLPAPKTH